MNEEALILMHTQMQEVVHREARAQFKQALNLLECCMPILYEYTNEDSAFIVPHLGSSVISDLRQIHRHI